MLLKATAKTGKKAAANGSQKKQEGTAKGKAITFS
jgi:hypothetical protein